ncbi:MAG: MlaD family protein [Pseudomonadota bacterium]
MSLFRDADPRFAGLDWKVAVFVVLGALASIGLLIGLAYQQGVFSAHTELKVEVPTGIDLRPGMAVKLSGFKIGDVKSVSLNEHAKVDLLIRIEDQYMKWIKADSLASVAREGLIGDSYLTVTSGNPELTSLKAGESLLFVPTPALADIAQDIRNRALPVIDGLTDMLRYLNDPKGDFRGSMGELRRLVAELRDTRRQIDRLLADVDKVASEDLRRTLANTDRTLATLEKEVTAMSTRTDASLARLDEATASAAQAADSAAKAIDSAAPRVDRLLDEADAAIRESRGLIDGASKRWPFKGGDVPERAPLPEPAAQP